MTTVGYGNLVPAANPGQTLAVIEAVVGQLFLVVAVGKIINSYTPSVARVPAREAPARAPADRDTPGDPRRSRDITGRVVGSTR
jgi:hypothetical protein